MSSNVTLTRKSSGSESDMPNKTVPQNIVDIRIDKEGIGAKNGESPPSNDGAEIKDTSKSSNDGESQLPNVNNTNSEQQTQYYALEKSKSGSKISERAKRKSWYNVIYPSYKSRSETFKKLFKEVPEDQRLIVDYSCALQREILVHGRMYVSQHYMCFHANIFGWETYLTLKWSNVTALTKEKTALVIPNAILISTKTEKYFITSFAARDKTYLMLFRIWQNALMKKPMLPQEIWQCVHNAYGEQLGLTSDDEDYIDPKDQQSKDIDTIAEKEEYTHSTTSETETDHSHEPRLMPKAIMQHIATSTGAGDTSTLRPTQSKHRMRKDLEPNEIPTDVSNSTDSEEENSHSVPFECTAECTSMHEGRQLVHTILPINVDSLLTMLFSKSKFFAEFHNMRKTTNMIYRDWIDNDDGTKTRTINFTVAVTQAVGPKTSNMTEVQIMRDCSVPGQLYSIDITSTNAGIPYADSFKITAHYCLVRTVDDHTMFSVYVQIKYTKHVWGVIKGFIEKNAWCGLENFYRDLLNALQSEYCIPPAKSKSRRTKKALSQKSSIEEPSSKRSSLKSITKTVSAQSTVPQISSPVSTMSTGIESIEPESKSGRCFLTFDMFSIFIMILIITLLLLNVYLIAELYVLKHKQSDSIQIDRALLDKLAATGDPNEIKEKWLNMLHQQKTVHEAELHQWQGFVRSAVELLKNIKEIYTKFNLELNVHDSVKDEF